MAEKPKKEKGKFTEEQNAKPPVPVIPTPDEPEEEKKDRGTEITPTRSIAPITAFAMPLATVDQVKDASIKYQQFLNALITEKDVVEMTDKKTGEKKMIGKKSAFGKIARFWGISTEIVKSVVEEEVCKNDVCVWSRFNGKSFPKIKRGDRYLIAKAWAKAVLPNGQFAVRGAATSESERAFAHIPHDLIATSETRAVKRAIEAVIGMGDIELVEGGENEIKKDDDPAGEEITMAQSKFINTALSKLGKSEEDMGNVNFKLKGGEKNIMDLDKNDAEEVMAAIKGGKEAFEKIIK